ncbi:hypothetical protein [Nonomuraea sp. NPDC052265]|uniref:hypothetical protein n=1 Tax=Nonomuraea sp. NPDC052265 TaxID=3364374 RepID=UPI0037CC51CD
MDSNDLLADDRREQMTELVRRHAILTKWVNASWFFVFASMIALGAIQKGYELSEETSFFVLLFLAVLVAIPTGLRRRAARELEQHRQQTSDAYGKLFDVQDNELEERLTQAAQRLHDTSRELAELQMMAAHRATMIEQLLQRSVDARGQVERDEILAEEFRKRTEIVRAFMGLQNEDLDRRQRRTNWFFFAVSSVAGFLVGLLTNWVYDSILPP